MEADKFTQSEWKTADEIISLVGDQLFDRVKEFILQPNRNSFDIGLNL